MGDGIFLNSLYTVDRGVLTLCNGHPIFFQIFAQVKMLVVENAFVSVFQLISPFTIYIHKFESYRHPKNAELFRHENVGTSLYYYQVCFDIKTMHPNISESKNLILRAY